MTTAYIEALAALINTVCACYYEEAPETSSYPFAVINNMYVTDLGCGDSANFYVDIYADEQADGATVTLENTVDSIRNLLTDAVLNVEGSFGSHISFDNRATIYEAEYDLCHRRLTFTARIFYV